MIDVCCPYGHCRLQNKWYYESTAAAKICLQEERMIWTKCLSGSSSSRWPHIVSSFGWYFTSNLKQLIKTYDGESDDIVRSIAKNNHYHKVALSNPGHQNHNNAIKHSHELTEAANILHLNLMSNLRCMAHMQPPAQT
jgi:hypothetical protein